MTAFPAALRAWRKQRGLSQEELGYAVGVSQTAVSAWECGAVKPSRRHRAALAAVTGLPPESAAPSPKAPRSKRPPTEPLPNIPHRQARALVALVRRWRARREDLINRLRGDLSRPRGGNAWQVNERASIWGQAASELEGVLREAEAEVAA